MRVFYDFHIHSALSPCGDNDNTPNNIVNMAKLKGLDVIALSDHNSSKNCLSTIKVGQKNGLLVLPAMELTTSEDIHVLCLFEKIENLESFESRVDETRLIIKNKEEIFGEQLIMDENDNIVDKYPNLLTVSSGISIDEVKSLVDSFGGLAIPAHIDKQSNGIVGILGAFDYSLGFNVIESKTESSIQLPRIINSDAHFLWDISEKENSLNVDNLTAEGILSALKNLKY